MTTTSSASANYEALNRWLEQHGESPEVESRLPALARLARGPAGEEMNCVKLADGSPLTVLMLLCQKVGATGSGVVLKEMVDRAPEVGVEYVVLHGGYERDAPEQLFSRQPRQLERLAFGTDSPDGLSFRIVGMSNRMPYDSCTFKDLSPSELNAYIQTWSRRIAALVREHRPQLIHVHHLWILAAIAAMEAEGIPVVISIHGTDLFRAAECPHLRELVRPWTSRFQALFALSRESVDEALELFPLNPSLLQVFGNGFNAELFYPRRQFKRESVPELSKVDANDRIILTVAKYDRRKGIEWLIRALAQLPASTVGRPHLLIAGSGPREERDRFVRLISDLNLTARITLLGEVAYDYVPTLMNAADLFVLPAYREPFGLVLLEALACGCPVVTTAQAGPLEFIPEALRETGDAVLIPGLSGEQPPASESGPFVECLAHAMAQRLKIPLDFARREKIAQAVAPLTWTAYMQRMGAIYRRLLT